MKSRKFSQAANLKFVKDGQFCIPKEDIIREGYMFKYSSSVWKQWRARYVILTCTGIYCYKHMSDFKDFPLEVIPIEGVTMTLEEVGIDKAKMFCVKLSLPTFFTKKHHLLGCHNNDNRDEWMTAILQALTNQRMEEREKALIEGFTLPGGSSKRNSRSLTDLSAFSVRKRDRPRSADISTLFSTITLRDKLQVRHVRREKALSLVENINVRNDFFLK